MMNTENWSRAQARALIKEYKKYQILYDSEHEDYLDHKKRSEAYYQIAVNLKRIKSNVSAMEVRKKLITLNKQMKAEQKRFIKHRKGEGNADEEYTPVLWCFQDLSFVLNDTKEDIDCDSPKSKVVPKILGTEKKAKDEKKTPSATKKICIRPEFLAPSPTEPVAPMVSMPALPPATPVEPLEVTPSFSLERKPDRPEEEIFCELIYKELKDIKLVANYDIVTTRILGLIREVKADERKLLNQTMELRHIQPSSIFASKPSNLSTIVSAAPKNRVGALPITSTPNAKDSSTTLKNASKRTNNTDEVIIGT